MWFMTAGGLEPCFLSVTRQTWIWNDSAGITKFLFKCDWELIWTNIGNEDTRAKLHVILRCFGSIKDYNLVVRKVDLSNITWVLIIEYRRFPYLFPCCSQQIWWLIIDCMFMILHTLSENGRNTPCNEHFAAHLIFIHWLLSFIVWEVF